MRFDRKSISLAVLAVLAVLASNLCGCAMAGPVPSGPGVEGKADEDGREAPTLELAPAYSMVLTSHVVTEAPDGERSTFDSLVEGYLEPRVGEEGLALVLSTCHIELPETEGRKPRVADDTIRARGPIVLPALLTEDAEGRIALVTETGALELGVALDEPVVDDLPTSRSDERLVDHDDDGATGVTIDLGGWEIYVAARARVWLSGVLDAETGAVRGDAELSIDVQVYGDDIPFVDVRARVEASEDEPSEIVELDNAFVLTPLGDVPTGCAALSD